MGSGRSRGCSGGTFRLGQRRSAAIKRQLNESSDFQVTADLADNKKAVPGEI